jgi:hypothetical protein
MKPDDPELESMLRAALAPPCLPDDGFTVRVLRSLPRRRLSPGVAWMALPLAWGFACAGIFVALWIAGTSDWGRDTGARLGNAAGVLLSNPWASLALGAVLASYGVSLAATRLALRSLGGTR